MANSYRVHPKYIQEVNLAWKRKRFGREKDLAKELGLSLHLVIDNLFLKGEPVNRVNFIEICQFLGLNWQEVAGLEAQKSQDSSEPGEVNSDETIPLSRPTGGMSEVDKALNELVGTLCEMLRRLTRKAGDFLRADRTSIFLLDQQTQQLGSLIADDGAGGSLLIDIPADRGIAGLAASGLEIINIPYDVYDDPRSQEAKNTDNKTGYRTYTILAWPLFNERKDLVAVVQLINKLKPNYDPTEDLSKKIDTNGFTPEDEVLFARYTSSILQILEKCQFCYQLTQKLREDTALKKPSVLLQNAKLIAGLKQQEKQMRKFLQRM